MAVSCTGLISYVTLVFLLYLVNYFVVVLIMKSFYRAFNAVFGKIGQTASEEVIIILPLVVEGTVVPIV